MPKSTNLESGNIPGRKTKRAAKAVLAVALTTVAATVAALFLVAARTEPKITPNVYVGTVRVGGLTTTEAAKKLRVWWESVRTEPIDWQLPDGRGPLPGFHASASGLVLMDQATVLRLPTEDMWAAMLRKLRFRSVDRNHFEPVIEVDPKRIENFRDAVAKASSQTRPATARWIGGRVVTTPEQPGLELDEDVLKANAWKYIVHDGQVSVPVRTSPKRVSEEDLASIVEPVAEFTTRYPAGQVARVTNIRRAAEIISGHILMPGDKFSFNGIVGRRTPANGFKIAPVFVNGRHDNDVGGGICQVSTTIYNAALLANLKVVQRSNHSLPVAYVPLGRDAAVSYSNLDLVFENVGEKPIAIDAVTKPGQITVRILGQRDPEIDVKIVSRVLDSWKHAVKEVHDGSLPAGVRRVIDKGGSGHKAVAERLVYRNGVLLKREPLGTSVYRGGPRIVAVNQNAVTPAAVEVDPTPMSETDPSFAAPAEPAP